jgi:hypothetical protein
MDNSKEIFNPLIDKKNQIILDLKFWYFSLFTI